MDQAAAKPSGPGGSPEGQTVTVDESSETADNPVGRGEAVVPRPEYPGHGQEGGYTQTSGYAPSSGYDQPGAAGAAGAAGGYGVQGGYAAGQGGFAAQGGGYSAQSGYPAQGGYPAPTHGGYGEGVEDAAALPKALDRALDSVASGRQALLNVLCGTG